MDRARKLTRRDIETKEITGRRRPDSILKNYQLAKYSYALLTVRTLCIR